MQITLRRKIQDIEKTLKKAGKVRLAGCIEKNWNKTALKYSEELNFWRPKRPIEKELLNAFDKELKRLDTGNALRTEILKSINKRRILQTAPHLGATESPRMLCINWLGSLGVPEKEFYVVGMFSGIPFSNRSRPGRINKKVGTINLFPSNMQDGLVYQSIIPKKLIEVEDSLPIKISRFLPKAEEGHSYTKWALLACQHIERKILKKNNLIYLDINEVVTEYLIQVLNNKNHIFYKIFFDPKTRQEFIRIFRKEILFYTPVKNGKYEQMENMLIKNNILQSKTKKIILDNSEDLIKELKDGRLCPALITSFLVLAFLNEFKCFGSFAQVEYLPAYQQKLAKLKFLKDFNITKVPTANLTTGGFREKLFPIDVISGEKIKLNPNILFGELLVSMKDTLLKSYFTGSERNVIKRNKK
jgi:hypothetical protein